MLLRPTIGFQQHSFWLVNRATSISRHLGEQGFNTLHNLTTIWHNGTYMNGRPMTIQDHQKSHLSISRKLFLLRVELFPSLREETRLPPPEGFSQIQMWIVLKATPLQIKIIVVYCTSNHRINTKIGRWSTIAISRDNRLCHFCSFDAIEN